MLLQNAICPILISDRHTLIEAWVLLDSASQNIHDNNLAEQFKLLPQHREHLSASTFGAQDTKDADTQIVNLK